MQMLSTSGEEDGVHQGLNVVPGKVRHLEKLGCTARIRHVGWYRSAAST
jgi:imidazoleglycerol phosphate synthase glutamine amidotransferase subunit HisH